MDDELINDVKNKEDLFCTNCSSKILMSQVGLLKKCEMELPKMTQKKGSSVVETDLITECFQVKDPFHFENVGFSRIVNNVKYLACADCELGPVGWQELPSNICSIAMSRVSVKAKDNAPVDENAN